MKFYVFLCAFLLIGSHAKAQNNTPTPPSTNPYLGVWNYTILDTPDGDMAGQLTIEPDGKGQLTNDSFLTPAQINGYSITDNGLTFSTKVSLANGYTFNCKFWGMLKEGGLEGKLEVMEMGRDFEVVAKRPLNLGDLPGKWTYTIYNTPQGDLSGVLTIGKDGQATLANDAFLETVPVKDLVAKGNTFTFSASVTVADGQTFSVKFTGSAENNVLNGNMTVVEIEQTYEVKGKRADP
ncbi:MAG: hypothetical protein JNN12_05340 [Bacteroidetes Order II. Incertae sedis bacterium]|nr:hypothetical protein [Bacteroidetes Order II. bacterium]